MSTSSGNERMWLFGQLEENEEVDTEWFSQIDQVSEEQKFFDTSSRS